MKLAIAVVYLVSLENIPLLTMHLRFIERMTTSPWTIHVVVIRSHPDVYNHLRSLPNVILHDLQSPDNLKNYEEHSWYLDALLECASNTDCTHLATLHMDSFPIRLGWEKSLAAQLTANMPIAGILNEAGGSTMARICPSGILMTTEFFHKFQPRLYNKETEQQDPGLQEFLRQHDQKVIHSGINYSWQLHKAGLCWHPLQRTNNRNVHPLFAGIYGGVVFHLGASARGREVNGKIRQIQMFGDFLDQLKNPLVRFLHRSFIALEKRKIAPSFIQVVRDHAPLFLLQLIDRSAASNRIHKKIQARLLREQEAYLNYLQGE